MSAFFSSIGLPEIVAGIMVLVLNAYVLMGGADFGGGVWDLLASGPRREAQRTLVADAIAPIWEANHVWLIVVVVMLFTAFPSAFGTLGTVLHIPLTLMLVGIVMRGSAFVFRSYGSRDHTVRHRWGATFAVASLVTPIVLGMIIGGIASGDVWEASARLERAQALGNGPSTGFPNVTSFSDVYVSPWLASFQLSVGLFALSLFAYLAAVYLTIAAQDERLRDDFRARALASAVAVFVFAGLALVLAQRQAPRVAAGVSGSPWSIVLHICTGAVAITGIVALWRRRFPLARLAVGAQVSLILWGWALSQYPYILPPRVTIRDAAAPSITLELLLAGLAAGGLLLIPSLRYLFRTFSAADHHAPPPSSSP